MRLPRSAFAHTTWPLLAVIATSSCRQSHTERELAALRTRVDSFAVTLTAVTQALRGRSAPIGPEFLTVGTAGAAALGRPDAPVTIVEFTDYQCPFCRRHATVTFPDIKRNYIDRGLVRYVVRDLPLKVIHPFAVRGARAARCAGAQSAAAYWKYHDALFAEQSQLADSSFAAIAARIGLDRIRFGTCFSAEQFLADVQRDAAEAQALGVNSTPQFVIGRTAADSVHGMVLDGALPYSAFSTVIDAALKRASGNTGETGKSSR